MSTASPSEYSVSDAIESDYSVDSPESADRKHTPTEQVSAHTDADVRRIVDSHSMELQQCSFNIHILMRTCAELNDQMLQMKNLVERHCEFELFAGLAGGSQKKYRKRDTSSASSPAASVPAIVLYENGSRNDR